MFVTRSAAVLLFVGAFGSTVEALHPRQVSSSESSSSYSQTTTFMSSWKSLSQSFSRCQSVFSQHASVEVATQSVQQLYTSYQAATTQFNACSACSSSLSGGYSTEIQQSVTSMYQSFQSIIATGQQFYTYQWESRFAATFQSMSSFTSFSQQVCGAAGLNLRSILKGLNLDLNLFGKIGIDLGGIVNGVIGGILGGNGDKGGLLGSVLGAGKGAGNGGKGGILDSVLGGNQGGQGLIPGLLN